ncbi:MAG: SDR family oxidoreductase [Bacteroidota bacterium]|nr:SDR family oxidoreductase [Bacteroidota bacterium]
MNKTALITGASNGIGLELAKLFAADKTDLLLVARSENKMQALAESLRYEHGIKVWVLGIDLSDPFSAKEVKAFCDQQQLQVDYLVNNAGFGDYGLFAECDWNKQSEMINLNITTLTYLTRLFLPEMIQRHSGRILNVASTAAFQPGPLMSVYFATKAFVLSFSEAISNELEGTGVTVTVLCPGATESGFQKAAALEESKMVKDRKLPGSAEVAAFGYRAMKKGKVVVIHGFMNALMATSIRFSPRPLVRKIVRRIQEKG